MVHSTARITQTRPGFNNIIDRADNAPSYAPYKINMGYVYLNPAHLFKNRDNGKYTPKPTNLEAHFRRFRQGIIGIEQSFESPYGRKDIVYTDWTASGRLYRPIEESIINRFGPFVANTHTESTVSGRITTTAYNTARAIIKRHVNAGPDDVLIVEGSGMTGAINKFQRILGIRVPEKFKSFLSVPQHLRPVVFITHMEHHSNQTSWLETIADVVVIPPGEDNLCSLTNLEQLLKEYGDRPIKIASVTACSNVSGISTPYRDIAKLMHSNNGLCFVDFACSAPYVSIDMHPGDDGYLDCIFFSPHKFLGGPGTSGVLIFNKKLYQNGVPDNPGGGTVLWTNPWGGHEFLTDIEAREDGGTPAFLQTIKTALAIKLKEEMGIENMLKREHEQVAYIFPKLQSISNLHILAGEHRNRLGVISFYIDNLHHNLGVKLLNDRFGIQARGGCSCAGTYGHFLLNIDVEQSGHIVRKISAGELQAKPGWIRISIHPTTTNEELEYVCDSIKELAGHFEEWAMEYEYASHNEYVHRLIPGNDQQLIDGWFSSAQPYERVDDAAVV